jgi:hypothetical protein
MVNKYDREAAKRIFNNKRDPISGLVICRQCRTRYHTMDDTEIVDIETDYPVFCCSVCDEQL